MRRRFHLTFPGHLAGEPVLFLVGKEAGVTPNIRRASVEEGGAWMIVELDGDEASISDAVARLTDRGVVVRRVDEDE
ncbi:MAG TPA: NIL domain-containing protein [Actinomycetota bacterium]